MRTGMKKIRMITIAGMLIAISVVIGILCKNFLTFGIFYRITFENLPIIMAGLLFGPLVGGAAGVVADIISCLCSTNPAVNPIITLGAFAVGFTSGLFRKNIAVSGNTKLFCAVLCSHLIGQVAIKSVGKIVMFGMPWYGVFIGLGISVGVAVIEFLIIKRVVSGAFGKKLFGDK